MELWDQVEEIDNEIEEKSLSNESIWDSLGEMDDPSQTKYLRDPDEAIRLIAKVLGRKKDTKKFESVQTKLDYIIDSVCLPIVHSLSLKEELDIHKEFLMLKEKALLNIKFPSLFTKNIVAIAGGFSAGKSKFINSILGQSLLSEDINPTTSIPTFITNDSSAQYMALTLNKQKVDLDEEGFQSITHAFITKYQISLSSFIHKMIVQTPFLKYEHLNLLDTPGYTKAEASKEESQTDKYIAMEQLKLADYLIWLVHIENGTIKDEDLRFISDSGFTNPILIVFNQADKKPMSHRLETIEKAEKTLKGKGLNIYAVTAYSSQDVIEYTGNYIDEFLEMCDVPRRTDVDSSIGPYPLLESLVATKVKEAEEKKAGIITAISNSSQLTQVAELAQIFWTIECEHLSLMKSMKGLENVKKELTGIIGATMLSEGER